MHQRVSHMVLHLLGDADQIGVQGVLETISFFVLAGMIIAAYVLAGLLLVHTL